MTSSLHHTSHTSTGANDDTAQRYAFNVREQWVDYNGHMSDSYYVEAIGEGVDEMLAHIGLDSAYRASGYSVFTEEIRLHYRREARLSESLMLNMQVLDCDLKRLHLYHCITRADDGVLITQAEQMLVHVDLNSRHSSAWPQQAMAFWQARSHTKKDRPLPEFCRRRVQIRRTATI